MSGSTVIELCMLQIFSYVIILVIKLRCSAGRQRAHAQTMRGRANLVEVGDERHADAHVEHKLFQQLRVHQPVGEALDGAVRRTEKVGLGLLRVPRVGRVVGAEMQPVPK